MAALCGACGSEAADPQLPSGTAGVSGAGAGAGSAAAGAGAGTGASGSGSAGVGSAGSTAGAGSAGHAGSDAADGGGTAGTGAAGSAGEPTPTTGPFPPVADFGADGPFTATMMNNVGPSGGYTVYLPSELAPDGAKNPIVGWMSGGSTTHTAYTLLPRLATHGFVVVAANVVPNLGQEVQLGQQIIAGIDWAIAESEKPDSPFYGKLDSTKVAAAGYSMGSLATFTIADDERLTTTLHISGGNMPAMNQSIAKLREPAAFICGKPGDAACNILSTDCDIAAANCDLDFQDATTPVFYANFEGGHLGILTAPISDRINALSTAWLRYQLMGDTTLRSMFVGDQCEVCTDPDWKVQQKNLP